MTISIKQTAFIDMTEGSVVKSVFRFALPLIFANLFQQVYSFVDAAIVGQFVGVNAFAAIGSTSWVIWWLNTVPRDCSNVFSIAGSIRIGSKNKEEFRRFVALAIECCAVLSIVLSTSLIVFADPIMRVLNVQPAIYQDARTYFCIMALSLPIALAFHVTCALLRAAGNGSVTFRAMLVSTVLNVILDLLFVALFRWGVAGAAWATLLSQIVSAAIALTSAARNELFFIRKCHFFKNGRLLREAVDLFIPLALNSIIITAGGILLQNFVNGIGTHYTAGFSVGVKINSIFESVILALQTGASVFIGQNLGAKKPDRIRYGVTRIMLFGMIVTVSMIAFSWLCGGHMANLFLAKDDPALYAATHTVAVKYSRALAMGMLAMTPLYIFRAGVQTLGHPNHTLLAGGIQLVARIVTVLVLPPIFGTDVVLLVNVIAWSASLPAVLIPFWVYLNRLCRQQTA